MESGNLGENNVESEIMGSWHTLPPHVVLSELYSPPHRGTGHNDQFSMVSHHRQCQWSWSRDKALDNRVLGHGLRVRHWTTYHWVMGSPLSGTSAISHHLCSDDYLAQFRLWNAYKGELKHHNFLFSHYGQWWLDQPNSQETAKVKSGEVICSHVI